MNYADEDNFQKNESTKSNLSNYSLYTFLNPLHDSILSQSSKRLIIWRLTISIRIQGQKLNIDVTDGKLGENRIGSVFRDNRIERMRFMKGFEEIMSIGNVDLKGLVIEESSNSLIVTAKKKINVLEERIILMNQMTECGSELFMGVSKNKGGLIV